MSSLNCDRQQIVKFMALWKLLLVPVQWADELVGHDVDVVLP